MPLCNQTTLKPRPAGSCTSTALYNIGHTTTNSICIEYTNPTNGTLCRVIWSGLLGQLSQYPPEAVKSILDVIHARVLSAGDGIPATLQAQPFGDAALAQVCPGMRRSSKNGLGCSPV